MSKFKKGLMKRVMAIILSGAMVMSGMPSSNMTAFASEAPADTGGYVEEVVDEVSESDDADSKSADEEVKDDAEVESATDDAAAEETTKSEDNATNGTDDADNDKETAVETVEATETAETEVENEEQTSEVESSLNTEAEETESTETETETTEVETEEEDVNAEVLQTMTFDETNKSYIFNGADVDSSKISANAEIVMNNGVFSLLCGDNTAIDATKQSKFGYYDADDIKLEEQTSSKDPTQKFNLDVNNTKTASDTTKAVALGDDLSKTCAIKFITSQSVDVTVYWVANAANSQMSILDDSGRTVIRTYESTVAGKLYISTMTLKKGGTYYLGGNNKVYKVRVEPEVTKRTYWDFTVKQGAESTEGYVTPPVKNAMEGGALEFFDLRVDANTGKFQLRPNNGNPDVQANQGTIVHVPVSGRSTLSLLMNNTSYTVDGQQATNKEESFTCSGEGGYAVITVTGSGQYIKKIRVIPFKTVTVSGNVTLPSGASNDIQVIFTEITDKDLKTIVTADIQSDGTYSADLYTGVTYKVTLSEKSYNITTNSEIEVGESETGSKMLDITATGMPLEEVTGNIDFAGGQPPKDLKLKFEEKGGSHVVEDAVISGSTYTVNLKPNTTYTVTATKGAFINDYKLTNDPTEVSKDSADIAFVEKKKCNVKVVVNTDESLDPFDMTNVTLTFTNDDEEGYIYTPTDINNIKLRDGVTYSMSMKVPYPYKLDFPKKVTLNGVDAELTLNFTERTTWDFTDKTDLTLIQDAPTWQNRENDEYYGLIVNTKPGKFRVDAGKNLSLNTGTIIKVPVSGKGSIQIVASTNYGTTYKFNGKQQSTDDDATYSYDVTEATEEAKFVTIEATATCYIDKIIVKPDKEQGGDTPVEYIEEGLLDFKALTGLVQNDIPSVKGTVLKGIKWWGTDHGVVGSNGASIGLNLSKKANIEVVTCCFGSGPITPSSGTISDTSDTNETAADGRVGKMYTITGVAAGTLTLTFGATVYVHSINVEYIPEVVVPSGPRKIDVWDFGGKEETDTEKYENHITIAEWISKSKEGEVFGTEIKNNVEKPVFNKGEASFGDLTIGYEKGDRLYSTLNTQNAQFNKLVFDPSGNGSDNKYADYEAVGAIYGGGAGSTRNITIKNVIAGDTIVVYAGQHSGKTAADGGTDGPLIFYYEGQGAAKAQKGSVTVGPGRQFQKIEFIAEYSGSYIIWPERVDSKNNGKAMYHRAMKIPGIKVSGAINFNSFNIGSDYTVRFINQTTKQESIVEVNEDGSFELCLAPGYEYLAVLSGAPGYGFASEGKNLTVAEGSDAIENLRLTVERKAQYTYSGNLSGFAEDYDISRIEMTMIPPAESTADKVDLTIDKDAKSFTALLDTDVEYTIQMKGVDDYQVETPRSVKSTEDVAADIVVKLKPRHTVSGGLIGLEDAEVTELKFVLLDEKGKEDNNYVYTATVTNDSYSAILRDGAYIAKATVNGYKTQTHVVVNGKDTVKDLLFVSTAADTTIDRVANLYVRYSNRPNNYATIRDAVKAAKRMNPSSEAERITIHIAPGVYREQVIVDVPYITFTNDNPNEEVKITWYYGIGYAYYSCKNGFYDEERAHDKYEKANATKWGCAVNVAASDFRAENIVFENSFNRYITQEEIADGVELHTTGTDSETTFVRTPGLTEKQISSKAATERAAAVAIDGNRAEFYQCEFYGSQDTVYTGSSKHENQSYTYSYFKDCFIEGNTDFLFGDSNSVYENCTLSFAGYSDTDKLYGGIIAVNKADAQHGYLFNECTITRSKTHNNGFGDLGRPWSKNARVVFMNTKQETADIVTTRGWDNMNSEQPAKDNPNYKEYNTTLLDGTEITLEAGSVRKAKYKTEIPVEDPSVYFDGWKPFYLTYDESQTVKEPVSNEKRSDVPKGTKITLTSATTGAKIYYTLDTTDPTADSEEYKTPIDLGDEEKTVVIKAIAIKGEVKSNIAVFEYTVKDAANLIAPPTATVPEGKVDKGTQVKLECATTGADIYYTTDGTTTPTVKKELLYRGQPIIISETTTIMAISEKGGNVSDVVAFEYIVPEPVDEPTSDTPTGKVPVGTKVTLRAIEGAKIYYTINGGDPTENDTEFVAENPIDLGNEAGEVVIKAIAVKDGVKSTVATFTYTVSKEIDPDNFVSPPISDTKEGEVEKGTKVVLTSTTTGAKIYYTINAGDPTENDAECTPEKPIDLGNEAGKVVIKAIAIKGKNVSDISVFEYTVVDKSGETTVAPPTSSLKPGTVPVGRKVTLRAEEGAKIYYTINGGDPTENDAEFVAENPIDLGNEAGKVVIKAIAVKGGVKSKVATFEYTVSTELDPDKFVAPPTSDTPEGEVEKGTKVILRAEEGAKIYYTLDGSDPTAESTEYTGPIDLGNEAKKIVIKAIAIKGENVSEISKFEYTVKGDSSSEDKEQVKAPEASPAAGAVAAGTKVTLKSATEGAKIYYTLGEADPTVESKLYTDAEPITITEAVTIKAFAVKEGMKDSEIAKFAYTILTTPVVPADPDDPGDDKKDIWITGLEAQYYYTGAKITPDIKVWDCDIKGNDRLLVPGIDYAVSYKNNSKVSTATVKAEVIITGKGNYEGKGVTEKFEIVQASSVQNPINVKGAKVELVDKKYAPEYDGTPKTPDFKLVIKGKPEVVYTYNNGSYVRKDGEPMDVNVAVSNNINKGSATILVTGEVVKGKATSAKAAFKIMPVDLSKATVNVKAESAMYAVKGAIPEVTVTCNGVTLVNGRDYVAKFGNNKKAKVKGTVTIAGKGNYTKNAKPVTFDIDQLDMSRLSVSAATVYEKAKAGKIKATVLDQDGNELKPAQYTLKVYKADGTTEYGVKDELKAGDKIFIQAVAKDANLTGSTPKSDFKVGKDISKAKFKLKKGIKKSYTGSEVELVATDFEPVTLKGVGTLEMGRDFEIIAYSNNINKGNATAVIRGIGDYSGTKTIKFKITQKTMIKGTKNKSN